MVNNKIAAIICIAVEILIAVLLIAILNRPQLTSVGSIATGNEYLATSTASGGIYGAQNLANATVGSALIKGGYGAFGSVIIEGAATGVFNIYNATTTNVNLRTGNTPSSTILMASFPASATAGTYTFDEVFTTGLLLDLISGVMPTTTITYRQ